jgi:murein DD-endopeptidase MepM/ murein hydrolase activator NlpD
MGNGVITAFPSSGPQGNGYSIDVWHENQDGQIYWVEYTHFKQQAAGLSLGVFIDQGTLLGYYTEIGFSDRPHLHISMRTTAAEQRGGLFNPMDKVP